MEARDRILERLRQPPFDRLPEWKREELLEISMDAEGLRVDLVNAGYPDELDYPHTTAYINAIKPIPRNFIDIVLRWCQKLKFKGSVIGYLRESAEKYDGSVLIPIFNEGSKQVRWRICDAIAYNPPLNINNWVKEIYLDRSYGYEETGLLPLAIIKLFLQDEARNILRQGFDHHSGTTPEALGKVGKVEDIPFLEKRYQKQYESKFIYKEIEKAIKKIKKRNNLS